MKFSTMVTIRIIVRLLVLGALVTLIVTLKLNIRLYMETYVSRVETLGPIGGPVIFCICACLWCTFSPMGYLPTVVAGATFSWYVAPLVSYISVSIGSIWNMVFIRQIVLRFRCCQSLFKLLFGEKMGKILYLERALMIQPIKIVILARFPYLSNGLFNYMFSLSSVRIRDCAIGNAVGFIPGSILFSIFGSQIRSLALIIRQGGGHSDTKEIVLIVVICVITGISYGLLVWKVRKLLKDAASDVAPSTKVTNDPENPEAVTSNQIVLNEEDSVELVLQELQPRE